MTKERSASKLQQRQEKTLRHAQLTRRYFKVKKAGRKIQW